MTKPSDCVARPDDLENVEYPFNSITPRSTLFLLGSHLGMKYNRLTIY